MYRRLLVHPILAAGRLHLEAEAVLAEAVVSEVAAVPVGDSSITPFLYLHIQEKSII